MTFFDVPPESADKLSCIIPRPAIIIPAEKKLLAPHTAFFPPPLPLAVTGQWQTIWSLTLNSNGAENNNRKHRNLITTHTGSGTYTMIRVTFEAASDDNYAILCAGPGIATGTNTNTVETPDSHQFKFSGANTFDLSLGTELTSDDLAFNFSDSDDLIIAIDTDNGDPRKNFTTAQAGDELYDAAGTSCSSTTGGAPTSGRISGINKIEAFG